MARTIAKDYDLKRRHIQHTATRVFAEHGFDRASMALVSREGGISKAAIYHYYDSKDALLFDMLETHLRELLERVQKVDVDSMTPEDGLHAIAREIMLDYRGSDNEHKLQVAGLGHLPDDQQEILREYQRGLVAAVSDRIAKSCGETLANDKKQLRLVTMSFFGMLNWHFTWASHADESERIEYAALVVNVILNGVKGLP